MKVLVDGCHDYNSAELEQVKDTQGVNDVFVVCPLDTCQFTSGSLGQNGYHREHLLNILNILKTSPRYQNSSTIGNNQSAQLVTIHANFLNNGNMEKYVRLYENGLWYANPGSYENGSEFYTYFNMTSTFNR